MAAFPLFDLGVIVVAATLAAYLAKFFHQPKLLAYVIAGVVIGPFGLNLLQDTEVVWGLAELGIAFLLFIVGLELDLSKLKEIGADSLLVGLGQMAACFLAGFFLASFLGFAEPMAAFLSAAFVFSSTMVVVKSFSDSGELQTLSSRIAIGVLLLQDIVVILILAMMSPNGGLTQSFVALSLVKGLGLFALAYVAGKVILPPLFDFVAHSRELLFLSALSWCLGLALFASLLGFSLAIGAFLAGVAMASLPFSLEVKGELRSLKDFFSIIFFASLGMELAFGSVAWLSVIAFSALVLLFKPFALLVLTALRRHTKRTSFLAAAPMGQVSEFSLILGLHALSTGLIGQDSFSVLVLVTAITITATSYFSKYSEEIYRFVSPYLNAFERKDCKRYKLESADKLGGHIILFGCDRTGYHVLKTLKKMEKDFLVVDYNPDVISALKDQGVNCVYGDLADHELLEHIRLKDAKVIVSTVPLSEENQNLVHLVKGGKSKAFVVATASTLNDALKLYEDGADYVILPNYLAGERISSLTKELLSREGTAKKKRTLETHLKELKEMKEEQLRVKYEPPFLRGLKFESKGSE